MAANYYTSRPTLIICYTWADDGPALAHGCSSNSGAARQLEASLADSDGNRDFETLVRTRDALHQVLRAEAADFTSWGRDGKLLEYGHE